MRVEYVSVVYKSGGRLYQVDLINKEAVASFLKHLKNNSCELIEIMESK